MASISQLPSGRWRARYRDESGRQHSNEKFKTKKEAKAWVDDLTASVVTGRYVDPGASSITVGAWSTSWLASQVHLRPSSRLRTEGILAKYVVPRWGLVRLRDVTHARVQAWVAELIAGGLAPASVFRVHFVMTSMLELAVRDRRLPSNPARGVRLPRSESKPRRFLTAAQVEALAGACEPYGVVVRFLAFTGLRWGEMAALRVADVDPLRRRIHVARSVTEVNGSLVVGAPKSGEARTVPLPAFLAEQVAGLMVGKAADELVFTTARGDVLRNRNFARRVFGPAAEAIGEPNLTPHGLRHTAASLAIAAGANVKVVQAMLGHKTAAMTMDLYGHLMPDQLDDVADRLDVIGRNSAEISGRSGEVTRLPLESKTS